MNVVLMSVYSGDRVDWFSKAFDSIDFSCIDLALVGVDGPVQENLANKLMQIQSESVHVLWFERNEGLGSTLNKLIAYAKDCNDVSLFFRLDADDICHHDRFKAQVAFMKDNPDVGVSGSFATIIDFHGNETGKTVTKPTGHFALVKYLPVISPFIHPSVVFRASVLYKNMYPDWTHNYEDVVLWGSLAQRQIVFANLPKPLIFFRETGETRSRRIAPSKTWWEFKYHIHYVYLHRRTRIDLWLILILRLVAKACFPSLAWRFRAKYRSGI